MEVTGGPGVGRPEGEPGVGHDDENGQMHALVVGRLTLKSSSMETGNVPANTVCPAGSPTQ